MSVGLREGILLTVDYKQQIQKDKSTTYTIIHC